MSTGRQGVGGVLRMVAAVCVIAWPALARADIGGEVLAALSWVILVPLGIVQVLVVARMRTHVSRSWVGLTALLALGGVVIGASVGLSAGGGRYAMGQFVAFLGFLPGVPLAIDLIRRKVWLMAVIACLPSVVAAVLLEGVGR